MSNQQGPAQTHAADPQVLAPVLLDFFQQN
jgi:hypothetical protein